MKVAPDLETTVAARLEDGSLLPWLRDLYNRNTPTFREAMRYIFKKGDNPDIIDRIYSMLRDEKAKKKSRYETGGSF